MPVSSVNLWGAFVFADDIVGVGDALDRLAHHDAPVVGELRPRLAQARTRMAESSISSTVISPTGGGRCGSVGRESLCQWCGADRRAKLRLHVRLEVRFG
jgi:hypothetical protein